MNMTNSLNNYWYRQLSGNEEEGYSVVIRYFNQPYHEGNGFSITGSLGDSTSITKYDSDLTVIEEGKAITKIPRTGERGILSIKAVSKFNEIKFSKKGELTRYSPIRVTLFTHYEGLESEYSEEYGESIVYPPLTYYNNAQLVDNNETLYAAKEAEYIDFYYSSTSSSPDGDYAYKIRDIYDSRTKKFIDNEKSIEGQFEDNWWQKINFDTSDISSPGTVDETQDRAETTINKPSKFKIKNIDKITNFNPLTDKIEIDTDSFGIDSFATFAVGKNKKKVKKKLAKQDFDFLYDQKKGGLYFNENGADKGFGDGGIIAILKGAPELTSDNLEFI